MEAGYHWHQNATSQYDIIHSTYQLITNIYIGFYFAKIGVFHAVDAKHTEGDWQAKRINYVGKSSIVIVCRLSTSVFLMDTMCISLLFLLSWRYLMGMIRYYLHKKYALDCAGIDGFMQ
eukprot:643228_1